jgi:hypothetical protein
LLISSLYLPNKAETWLIQRYLKEKSGSRGKKQAFEVLTPEGTERANVGHVCRRLSCK